MLITNLSTWITKFRNLKVSKYIPQTTFRFQVLEFVDDHGNEVLSLGSFTLLPQHIVRLIMSREELNADEFIKFQAALMWSKKYCDSTNQSLTDVLGTFLDFINFHMIPANVLMKEIHPLGLVPYHIIMNALAYQVRLSVEILIYKLRPYVLLIFPLIKALHCW